MSCTASSSLRRALGLWESLSVHPSRLSAAAVDGGIDFPTITTWVKETGYSGLIEVGIFNQEIWDGDNDATLETLQERYAKPVLPFA